MHSVHVTSGEAPQARLEARCRRLERLHFGTNADGPFLSLAKPGAVQTLTASGTVAGR